MIATINQLAIERDVLHCRVIIARSLSELVAIREEIEPLLIINNSHYLLEDAVNNYITVKNIITAAGIEQIKHFLGDGIYSPRFKTWSVSLPREVSLLECTR